MMHFQLRFLSAAILLLLSLPSVAAWDCRAGADGKWDCVDPANRSAEPKPAVEEKSTTAASTPIAAKTVVAAPPLSTPTAEPVATAAIVAEMPKPEATPSLAQQYLSMEQLPAIEIANGEQCQQLGWPKSRRLPKLEFSNDPNLPIQVEADVVDYDRATQVAHFSGDVRAVRGKQLVTADKVEYRKLSNELDAEGNVKLYKPDIQLSSDSAQLKLDSNQGTLGKTDFVLSEAHARGSASAVTIIDPSTSVYYNPVFTSCPNGNDDWYMQAKELEINRETEIATAQHATLKFKDVPILYLPYASFPIGNERKTGFLVPKLGYSTRNGFQYAQPYYLNLAPNYDLTLTPRILSKRGLVLGAKFRYLTEINSGYLGGEYLPDDRLYNGDNQSRGAIAFRHRTKFSQRFDVSVKADWTSDVSYLDDVASNLRLTSTRHLERNAVAKYRGDNWSLLGRVQSFQTIDEAIPATSRPYTRLPQILYEVDLPDRIGNSHMQMRAEYVNFQRDDSVDGQRIDVYPSIAFPMRRSWGYVTPKLSARYTHYALRGTADGAEESPTRSTGTFSLDSGLFFDRPVNWFGFESIQTLEPRVFYTYTPYVNQDDIPIFDADNVDFSFLSLFYENRFSGADRVGDANQLTLALTSRTLYQKNGIELLRASLGQIFYFADRRVFLPGEVEQGDSTSAMVGELAAALSYDWDTRASIQWNPGQSKDQVEKAALKFRYHPTNGNRFIAGYRMTRDVVEDIDISASWAVTPQWRVIGRYDYSTLHDRTIEVVAGIETGNCCWTWRALVRQYLENTNEDPDITFMFQLELRGLGKIGNGIEEYLHRSVEGYNR